MKRLIIKTIPLFMIPIVILLAFSLLNLFYAPNISNLYNGFFSKQIIWSVVSLVIFALVFLTKPKILINNSFWIYLFNCLLLALVLIFGKTVNGSRAWFKFGLLSFQPSEFMKLSLVLYLTKITSSSILDSNKENIIFLVKIFIITLIPSLLTFLEPDTGAVIIYIVIALAILLSSKIKKKYLIYIFSCLLITLGLLGFIFFFHKEIFIKIFGSSMFYRIERISNFSKGMQIENSLATIGSSKFICLPSKASNLYFPEAPTDFILSLTINNFGICAALVVLGCYIYLDILLIISINKIKNCEYICFTKAFLFMFIYQQIQNIFMNIGLVPIIGIPLPFLSYGGSGLILYMICIAIIIHLFIDNKKYSYRAFYR